MHLRRLATHLSDGMSFFHCSAESKSQAGGQSKPGTRALGNQVIRKGHMCIQNLGIMKGMINFGKSAMIHERAVVHKLIEFQGKTTVK